MQGKDSEIETAEDHANDPGTNAPLAEEETIKTVRDVRDLDAAAVFLAEFGDALEVTPEDSARVRRKVSGRSYES
jgi:hypothetical protein